jgi:hypothetical protein
MLSADCVRPTCAAARLIEPVRATMTKFLRSARSSTVFPIFDISFIDIGLKYYQLDFRARRLQA